MRYQDSVLWAWLVIELHGTIAKNCTLCNLYFFVAGRTTLSLFAAYGITKYGVEAFSDALRREMSPWGVLVSVIEPGKFQTGITYQVADSVKQLWNNLSPEMKEDYEDKRLDGSKS